MTGVCMCRDVEEHDQIQRDLERTHQSLDFFNTDLPSSRPHHIVRHPCAVIVPSPSLERIVVFSSMLHVRPGNGSEPSSLLRRLYRS